nr:unnamed protein product [Callosobruchus analis]
MATTHCVIHRQTLASKPLPQKLRQTFDSAMEIVNYIKNSVLNSQLFTLLCEDLDSNHKALLLHTEVRWLSKGNMLARLHKLKEEKFWNEGLPVNSKLTSLALREVISFFSTYLYEICFSALVFIKTKQKNRFDIDSDLIIALTKTEPRINQLVLNMQSQGSH